MLHRARGVEEMAVVDKTAEVCEDSAADDEPEDILNIAVVNSQGYHNRGGYLG